MILIPFLLCLAQWLCVTASITYTYLDDCVVELMNLIKLISLKKFTLSSGKDRIIEAIYQIFNDYNWMNDKTVESDKVLPYIIHNRLPKTKPELNCLEYFSLIYFKMIKKCVWQLHIITF